MAALRPLCWLVAAALLVGCFEDEEERARAAYESGDFARAAELAEGLAARDHPRGHEIQALLTAQGIGRDQDYSTALAMADRAAGLDPAYAASRQLIFDRIAADEATAVAAFDRGDYARAHQLARPLADYGSGIGRDLLDRLYSGHHVLLPGSELTWDEFWNRCSGNTLYEHRDRGDAVFAEECAGRRVVWEGDVAGSGREGVTIRMTPGRPRVLRDLVLEFEQPPGDIIKAHGRKVRFAGTIAARGDSNRPDRLIEAAVIGPAYATQARQAEEAEARIARVRIACIDLLTNLYRTSHAPEWVEESRRRAIENNWPAQPMAFSIRVLSPDEAFREGEDGVWTAEVHGIASIILARVKPGRHTEIAFEASCTVRRLDTKTPSEIGTAEIFSEAIRLDYET